MAWVVTIFILAAIFFYPLTLCLRAEEGKLRLYWLPRVFIGYAPPQPLPVKQLMRLGSRERRRDGGLKKLRRLWRVARTLRLRKLWFDFLFLRPGSSHFDGECIISFSLCDIMLKSLRRWQRRLRRKKHVWRA